MYDERQFFRIGRNIPGMKRKNKRDILRKLIDIPPSHVIGTEYGYTATGQGMRQIRATHSSLPIRLSLMAAMEEKFAQIEKEYTSSDTGLLYAKIRFRCILMVEEIVRDMRNVPGRIAEAVMMRGY